MTSKGGNGAGAPPGLQNQSHGGRSRGGFNSHYPSPKPETETELDNSNGRLTMVSLKP